MSRFLAILSVSALGIVHVGAEQVDDASQPANPQDGAQQTGGGLGGIILPLFLVLIGFMLWSSFRTQKKEKQKLQQLIADLKIGDRVETIGGLRGEVVRRGEGEFDLKTGGEHVFTVAAGAIKQTLREDRGEDNR